MTGFNATPQDGSVPPIPMSSVVVPGDATPRPVRGGPAVVDSNSNTIADVALYTYDGDNVTMGSLADAAWSGSGNGSMIALLKKIVAGQTGTATVVQSTGAPAGTNWRMAGDFTEVAGQAAGSVTSTSTPIIPWTDVSAFKSWYFQMSGTWSMTLQVQFSNDGVNPTQGLFFSASTNGGFTLITANGQYYGPMLGRWMRIIPTVWTSNASGVGTLELHTMPLPPHTMSVAQSGTWTVQPGNTANTTPWLIAHANNNASVPTGAANTVVKGSPGALATIVVTTAGTGAGNVLIFDNATINSGTVLFAFPATVSVAQFYQIYGWAKAGITVQNVLNGPVFTVYYA